MSSDLLLSFLLFLSLVSFKSPSSKLSFDEGFSPLYGEVNVVPYDNNNSVQLIMDEKSSSGFRSKLEYVHGYFEASIKLPGNYTAGVVATFYTSNNQKYPHNHDEIDFEFLGHVNGREWIVQTNYYGNESTSRGREERYFLWFDPSADFHRYGIWWTKNKISYYVDNVPIRHVVRVDDDFPLKEMMLYGTIWNGSDWATCGGKYKMDLTYGPYITKFSNFTIKGCAFNSTQCIDGLSLITSEITKEERNRMQNFRKKHMIYSYCYDEKRYSLPLSECVLNLEERTYLQNMNPRTCG